MSEPVILALIACTQAVLVVALPVMGVRLGKVRNDTAATREQVVNHHETNFREENDSRHAETRRWFAELSARLTTVVRDIGGIREEIRGVREDHRALTRRVDRMEGDNE